MASKIVVLSTTTQADGSFAASGVFWLTAPSNNVVPNPSAHSQNPDVPDDTLIELRSGTLVEQPFTSGLFVSGTSLDDVRTSLLASYTAAQAALDATNPPMTSLVGSAFDGTTWTTGVINPAVTGRQRPPQSPDGKPFTAPNIYPLSAYRYITGKADDLTNPSIDAARGTGPSFGQTLDTAGDSAPVEYGFVDPVWIAGGCMVPYGAQFGDSCTLQIVAPASTVTPAAGGNTGNCNLVDPGVGAAVLCIPAPGNGAYNVDLATAVPIPWGDDWIDQTQGYSWWEWSDGAGGMPLVGMGIITPSYIQKGRFNLFAIPITLVTHARAVPVHGGEEQQLLTNSAIEVKMILPQWRLKVWLHNETGHTGLKVAFYLDLGRART